MYVFSNPNPAKILVGDCVVRGISILTDKSWEYTYMELLVQGYEMYDMPSSNEVWGGYLQGQGYRRNIIPNLCPSCYTVKQFCEDNPQGRFLLATGSHVIAVIDGSYYDTWDSGDEVPIYFFTKEE